MARYSGGCHCGAVRYEVEADIEEVTACNCSICSRAGWLLTFVPESAFTLLQGKDALTDYQFGNKHIHHEFCRRCGIRSFSHGTGNDGAVLMAINVRCLDGLELSSLPVKQVDGASL